MSDTAKAPEMPEEKITDQDKHALDLLIMSRKLAIANAEKYIAENNASEANYKLSLIQLYSKYGMDLQKDAVDENGVIKRNAVKPQ
jgi:hypothetical protein